MEDYCKYPMSKPVAWNFSYNAIIFKTNLNQETNLKVKVNKWLFKMFEIHVTSDNSL